MLRYRIIACGNDKKKKNNSIFFFCSIAKFDYFFVIKIFCSSVISRLGGGRRALGLIQAQITHTHTDRPTFLRATGQDYPRGSVF